MYIFLVTFETSMLELPTKYYSLRESVGLFCFEVCLKVNVNVEFFQFLLREILVKMNVLGANTPFELHW